MNARNLIWMIPGILMVSACGKPETKAVPEGAKEVVGDVYFGSQCPYGNVPEPVPHKASLWDCPIGEAAVEFQHAPQPLIFQADCKKKTLTIRSGDRKFDSSWEVMPDGSFNLTDLQVGSTQLNLGGSTCTSYVTAEASGVLQCSDRDKVDVAVDVVWRLGKGAKPRATGPGSPTLGTECQLPATCYLHASTQVKQCQ